MKKIFCKTTLAAAALALAAATTSAMASHDAASRAAAAAAAQGHAVELSPTQEEALAELLAAFESEAGDGGNLQALIGLRGQIDAADRKMQGWVSARQAEAVVSPVQNEALEKLLTAFASEAEGDGLAALPQKAASASERMRSVVDSRAAAAVASVDGLPEFSSQAAASAEALDEGDVVLEFSDYQCGFCKRMFGVLQKVPTRVRVIEFPILGPLSQTAARYALAADKQGHYADFHIALMSKGRLSQEDLDATAEHLGLDMEQLKVDMNSEEVSAKINRNFQLAQLLGVRGTPFLVIKGKPYSGAIPEDTLRSLLQSPQ